MKECFYEFLATRIHVVFQYSININAPYGIQISLRNTDINSIVYSIKFDYKEIVIEFKDLYKYFETLSHKFVFLSSHTI